MNSYLQVWKRGFDFGGRSNRREYWMSLLIHVIVFAMLTYVGGGVGPDGEFSMGFLSGIYTLLYLIPAVAVTIRRFHDTGRRGWWILIGFIPVFGSLIVLIFMAIAGQPDTNQYGPSPK